MRTILIALIFCFASVCRADSCPDSFKGYSNEELCGVINEYDEVYNQCLHDTGVLEGLFGQCGYALEQLSADLSEQKYQTKSFKIKLIKANRVIRQLRRRR